MPTAASINGSTELSSPVSDSTMSNPANGPLYEVRDIPSKGKGMVALVDISKGTRILRESPLLMISSTRDELLNTAVYAAYASLNKKKQKYFNTLHNSRPEDPELYKWTLLSNRFPCGDEGSAVYRLACRLNHSCLANAFHAWNDNLGQETIHAVCNIKAGDEITINYGMREWSTRAERQEQLKEGYGFWCACELCTKPEAEVEASDTRRGEIRELDSKITHIATRNRDELLSELDQVHALQVAEFGERNPLLADHWFDRFRVLAVHGVEDRQAAELAYRARVAVYGDDHPKALEMMRCMADPKSLSEFGMGNSRLAQLARMSADDMYADLERRFNRITGGGPMRLPPAMDENLTGLETQTAIDGSPVAVSSTMARRIDHRSPCQALSPEVRWTGL